MLDVPSSGEILSATEPLAEAMFAAVAASAAAAGAGSGDAGWDGCCEGGRWCEGPAQMKSNQLLVYLDAVEKA